MPGGILDFIFFFPACMACGISVPQQGLNPGPSSESVESEPLGRQGTPGMLNFKREREPELQELRVLRQGWPGYLLAGGGTEHSVVSDLYEGCCISALLPNVQLHLSRQNMRVGVEGRTVLSFRNTGKGRELQTLR